MKQSNTDIEPSNTDQNLESNAEKMENLTISKSEARRLNILSDPFVVKARHYFIKLGIIEPKESLITAEKKIEILKKSKQQTLQTHLGTQNIERVQSTAEQLKKKYGIKKKATTDHIYTPVEKYYTFFGGRVVMRHWRKETWFGIPVKYYIFGYLLICSFIVFFVHKFVNSPNDLSLKKFATKEKYKHILYCIEKLNENKKILKVVGIISQPKVSKLTPSDRHTFRSKFVTEVYVETAIYGHIRMLFIYSTEKSMDGLQRIEFQMDDEILRIDINENKDFSNLEVVECPPDLMPMMNWFTESRREWFGDNMKYIWPIAPAIALIAVARWHFRAPAGLANYILDESKKHVIVRRSLGNPVHLQSDQWRGKLTSRSCNMRILLEGGKHKGKLHIVGYRDGSQRWLFPNCVLMIDDVKHDHYREMTLPPFQVPTANI